jgi:hypothetical protein
MTAFSNFLEAALLNHTLNNDAYTSPTIVYLALFTAAPSDTGGGTEVTGGSYVRLTVDSSTSNKWTVTSGHAENNADLTFVTATASWGTITHVGIFDASTSGNLLYHAALSASKQVDSGGQLKFLTGQFQVDLD